MKRECEELVKRECGVCVDRKHCSLTRKAILQEFRKARVKRAVPRVQGLFTKVYGLGVTWWFKPLGLGHT